MANIVSFLHLKSEYNFVSFLNAKTITDMIALLISLLIQIGAISTAAEYDNLSDTQKEEYSNTYQSSIIIIDLGEM